MVLVLLSCAALLLAQFLPGLLIVKLLDLGRDREERWVMAAVTAGPLSALVYLFALLSGWGPLYWILIGNIAALAVLVPWRTARSLTWSRTSRIALLAILVGVLVPYFLTTGSLYRADAGGNFVMDRALQRDVLFHVGVVRSLQHDYPPSLLSVSGLPIGYHVGYHLQLAGWARFFGIDAFDGLIRVGALWQILLTVSSAFLLARRFSDQASARFIAPLLVLGSGLGFLFFFRPSVDWWSLVFMDVTLVSIFLANPLLPALPLLFTGLALLSDYARAWGRGALIGCVYCLGFLLVVKMFLGAQVLAAMGLAAVLRRRDRRLRTAFATLSLVSLPPLAHTFLAAESSNTSVGLRPLEIVRYSMEKLDWERAVDALARAGAFEPSFDAWSISLLAALIWMVGFLGLRMVGLRAWAHDLFRGENALHRTMAWFVAVGFPVALIFRIAPAESEGLSRLEAQNDVVWFAAASGILLWFWTASALRGRAGMSAVFLLALPATVQHFVHAASLDPDRVASSRLRAARVAETLSIPGSIWLDPLDRSRPSMLPYVSGRAVVYDPYVGYDYMFVGEEEIDFRRHALAQFWASSDPSFRAWTLDYYGVDFVWRQGTGVSPLEGLEPVYSDENEHLFRVHDRAFMVAPIAEMATPGAIPMGGGGTPYLSAEFERAGRVRTLGPGRAKLYLPRAEGRVLRVLLHLDARHGGGELVMGGRAVVLELAQMEVEIELPPRDESGLHAIEVEWRGDLPLQIIELSTR